MESLFAVVQQWVSSGSIWLAAGGSFVGGALTAMNPCVIVMVPLLIGFIGGHGRRDDGVEVLSVHAGLYSRLQRRAGHSIYRRLGGCSVPAIPVHGLRSGCNLYPAGATLHGHFSHTTAHLAG